MAFVSTVYTPEHERLDKLLKAMYRQLEEDLKEDVNSDFMIVIGDTVVYLTLGGPQVEGLLAMINHIADENWHVVDVKNRTVTGAL